MARRRRPRGPGAQALRGDGAREHRVRQGGRGGPFPRGCRRGCPRGAHRGRDRRRGRGCQRARFHRRVTRRVRHARGRGRRRAVRRAASARGHRQGHPQGRADPDPRRGDERAGREVGGGGAVGAGASDARPDHAGHCASAGDGASRGRHRGDGEGEGGGVWVARGAVGARGRGVQRAGQLAEAVVRGCVSVKAPIEKRLISREENNKCIA
mmetsp:Transcript_9544/g.38654  ORF Transcript_9544/g.38654 Transcript_9544/m.38654 type:complete len:211 (+) Transcript_9544:2327-2959(+)